MYDHLTKVKNGEIELLRFIAAFIILLHHSAFFSNSFFSNGYLCVDFFFLLSGFLMAESVAKRASADGGRNLSPHESNKEGFHFLWRKLCSFYPELQVSAAIGIIVYIVAHPHVGESAKMAYQTFLSCSLLLNMTGFSTWGVIGGVWYLSSMLLGMAFLYPIIRRYGISCYLIAGAVLVMGSVYSIDYSHSGFIGLKEWFGIAFKGNIRAICEMALGAGLSPLRQMIHDVKWTQTARKIFTGLKIMALLVAIMAMNHAPIMLLPFVFLCFATLIVFSFAGICYDYAWYQQRWCYKLGKFSLPLYLSHQFYAQNICLLLPAETPVWAMHGIYIISSLITAYVVTRLGHAIRQQGKLLIHSDSPNNMTR